MPFCLETDTARMQLSLWAAGYFANILRYINFLLLPSATVTPLSVPITVQSYHPLECPAQVFHPTEGTETSASLSQTEECF